MKKKNKKIKNKTKQKKRKRKRICTYVGAAKTVLHFLPSKKSSFYKR
jgi:hypothetical protein